MIAEETIVRQFRRKYARYQSAMRRSGRDPEFNNHLATRRLKIAWAQLCRDLHETFPRG